MSKGDKLIHGLTGERENSVLVSIIVITYNSSNYVLETLESVKQQTYENLEIIISDDCSSDNTVEICRKWLESNADRFARSELITVKKNTGIPANLNRAYKACRGEWIKGVAGDDVLLKTCVEENLQHVLKENDIDILFSYKEQYLNNFEDENYLYRVPFQEPSNFFNSSITAEQQYKMLLIKDRIGVSATLFVKRELIENIGFFDERFKFCDDYPLWMKLTKSGIKLHFMPKSTVNHRAHADSVYNAKIDEFLINPSFFQREELREILVYPNISILSKIAHKYNYYVSFGLVKVFKNRRNFISKSLHSILLKYFNPLKLLELNI